MNNTRRMFRFLIALAGVAVVAMPRHAEACAVCYGAAGDKVNDAMAMAILGMLVVLMGVLGSFVGFFLYLRHRSTHTPEHLTELADLDYASAKDLGA